MTKKFTLLTILTAALALALGACNKQPDLSGATDAVSLRVSGMT